MKLRVILVWALLLCGAIRGTAQERLYLEQISVAEDLPHTDVNAITGDAEGFIWFGTYSGLCRYDGIRMEVFNVTNSPLKSSRIKALYLADNGLLYIGTETGGLTVYDTYNDIFLKTISVPRNSVNALFGYEDKVCICTDAGISLLEFSIGGGWELQHGFTLVRLSCLGRLCRTGPGDCAVYSGRSLPL